MENFNSSSLCTIFIVHRDEEFFCSFGTKPGEDFMGKNEKGVQEFQKITFVLLNGKTREATLDEIANNRIPPDVLEVITLWRDGKETSFYPSPLGL